MGLHSVLSQGLLQIVMASLFFHVNDTYGSPLTDSRNLCPGGWYHYEHFCVTQGQGSTEKAVALYCGGLGGIGINGLCIIKAPGDSTSFMTKDSAVNFSNGPPISASNSIEPASETDPSYSTVSDDNGHLSLYRDSANDVSSHFADADVLEDSEKESRLCPKRWTHYKSMCVYRPWSVEERCSLLNAVEFRGLCIKHADTKAATKTDLENIYSTDKRICCCASFKAKGNNYGC
ncbi:hypothetical protein BsWGS_01331 [Bradybaena similaris]